jgi:hypothetical protein
MLGFGLLAATGCRHGADARSVENYIPQQGSVAFEAVPSGLASNGSSRWDATFANGKTARFKIDLGHTQPLKDDSTMSFGHGRLIAVDGSDPSDLLKALKANLEAKKLPLIVQRVQELKFDYVILGKDMSQISAGGFTGNPSGHWLVMKLFVAPKDSPDDAEVFLNLNDSMKKGEFAIKDADYGDDVLAQLARVL